jgi:hypothetical protein
MISDSEVEQNIEKVLIIFENKVCFQFVSHF